VLSFGHVTLAREVGELVTANGADLEEIVLASMRESGKEVPA